MLVPKGNSEHTVEALQCVIAPLFVGVHDDLSVAVGSEAVAGLQELSPQLPEVIDFTIEGHYDVTIFVGDRLSAPCQVNNSKAPHGHANIALNVKALVIRSAMLESFVHSVQERMLDRLSADRIQVTTYTAHVTISEIYRSSMG